MFCGGYAWKTVHWNFGLGKVLDKLFLNMESMIWKLPERFRRNVECSTVWKMIWKYSNMWKSKSKISTNEKKKVFKMKLLRCGKYKTKIFPFHSQWTLLILIPIQLYFTCIKYWKSHDFFVTKWQKPWYFLQSNIENCSLISSLAENL